MTYVKNKNGTISVKHKGRVIYVATEPKAAAWFAGAWSRWTEADRAEFLLNCP